MKRILFLIILSIILIVPLLNAALLQTNKVFVIGKMSLGDSNWLKHIGVNNIKNYGRYEIHESSLLGLLRGEKTQEYQLLYSDNSVINAVAYLKVINYKPNKLIGGLWFKGKIPKDIKIFYLVNKSKYINKPQYKTECYININNSKECKQIFIGNKKIKRYYSQWVKYTNKIMPTGEYKIKIQGKLKKVNSATDWILKSGYGNYDLENWAWWNSSWNYKKEITIQKNSGTNLNNYPVLLSIPYNSHMNSDFSDIRFTDSNETNELNYWIENKTDSDNAWIWVNVPLISASSNTSIYMYYGNGNASSNSNGYGVFSLFDDFNDGIINSSLWTADAGCGESGGILACSASSNHLDKIYSSINYSAGYALVSRYKTTASALYTAQKGGFIDPAWTRSKTDVNEVAHKLGESGVFMLRNYDGIASDRDLSPDDRTNYHRYQIKWANYSLTQMDIDNGEEFNNGAEIPTSNLPVLFGADNWGAASEIYLDYAFVRKLVSSEPTYDIGSETQPHVYTTLNSPTNNSLINVSLIKFNWTSTPVTDNLKNTTLYVWNSTGTLINNTYKVLSGSEPVINILEINLNDGDYIWNAQSCDTYECYFAPMNYSFRINTNPPLVNITYPKGLINNQEKNNKLDFNWAVYGSDLDSCWYNYNGTNIFVNCMDNHTFINTTNYYNRNITFYANNTFGNTNQITSYWDYKSFINSFDYSKEGIIGQKQYFYLNVSSIGNETLLAYLDYNGTTVEASKSGSDSNALFTASIIPYNTGNISFHFIIYFGNEKITLQSYNQSISPIEIHECDSTYTHKILNITNLDESTKENILTNSSIKLDLNLMSVTGSNISSYSNNFNKNNVLICVKENTLSDNPLYEYLEIMYSADNHVKESYYMDNYSIINTTPYYNLSLYDLNSSKSQVYKIILKNSQYLPLSGAIIQIKRKYVEDGESRVVEVVKTDEKGETIAHLVTNDAVYSFIILKGQKQLQSFNTVKAICATPTYSECEINLNLFQSNLDVPNYETEKDFQYTLVYNKQENKIISDFLIPSGKIEKIVLNVTNENPIGTSICSNSFTTSSGELSCLIPEGLGNQTVRAELYKNGTLIAWGNIKINNNPKDIYNGTLIFLGLFFIFTIIGLSLSSNPIVSVFILLIGVIILIAFNIINSGGYLGATSSLLWLVLSVILIIIKGGKRS